MTNFHQGLGRFLRRNALCPPFGHKVEKEGRRKPNILGLDSPDVKTVEPN